MRFSSRGGNYNPPPSPQRGSILITSMGVVIVLTILGAGSMRRSMTEHGVSRRSTAQQGAFFLAEAALDRAALNLRTPDEASDDVTMGSLPTGSYTIDTPQLTGTLQYTVTTHGTSRGESRHVEALFGLTPQSVFQFALFGDASVNVSGDAQTDSYDSSQGPYEDDPASPDYNKSQNGDIGTNATGSGGVSVGGSIFIEGQVAVGPSVDDPTSVVTGYDPAFITGDPKVVSQPSAFPLPPVTVPGGLTCTDYTVQGNTTTTLEPGTYCYDDLTIQGNATLTASGDVTIYVTGQLTAQGNSVVGASSDPSRMLFLMSASAEATLEQTIQGNNTFYGGIYGPEATFTIQGNAEIFGSVIARQVNVTGNAEIHYDESLQSITELSNTYQPSLLSWREVPQ